VAVLGGVLAPFVRVFPPEPVVQALRCKSILAERPQTVLVADGPVLALVPDEFALIEPSEDGADGVFVDARPLGYLGRLERRIVVGDEELEDALGVAHRPEFLLGRVLEVVDVDGHLAYCVRGRRKRSRCIDVSNISDVPDAGHSSVVGRVASVDLPHGVKERGRPLEQVRDVAFDAAVGTDDGKPATPSRHSR